MIIGQNDTIAPAHKQIFATERRAVDACMREHLRDSFRAFPIRSSLLSPQTIATGFHETRPVDFEFCRRCCCECIRKLPESGPLAGWL